METIAIAGTEDTPAINFNYQEGVFLISGRSLPEDVSQFYQPVLDWLAEFGTSPKDGAKFEFKLEYFNTASSKILLDIFQTLEEISGDSGSKFSIVWHYQNGDTDMLEAGEEYAELVDVPVEFVA